MNCGFINTLDFVRRKFYNITNNVYWDICKLLFPFYTTYDEYQGGIKLADKKVNSIKKITPVNEKQTDQP